MLVNYIIVFEEEEVVIHLEIELAGNANLPDPVDYGLEHSREFGHARYGRTYSQGNYPQWSKSNPLHFIGHSIVSEVRATFSKQH